MTRIIFPSFPFNFFPWNFFLPHNISFCNLTTIQSTTVFQVFFLKQTIFFLTWNTLKQNNLNTFLIVMRNFLSEITWNYESGFIKIFAVLVLFSRIIHFLPLNYDFGTFFYCLFAELHDNDSAIGACVLLQFLFFIPSSIIQKSQFFSLCFINTTTMFRLCLSFCALGVGRISSHHHRIKSLR